MNIRRTVPLILAPLLLVIAAACGDDKNDTAPSTTGWDAMFAPTVHPVVTPLPLSTYFSKMLLRVTRMVPALAPV